MRVSAMAMAIVGMALGAPAAWADITVESAANKVVVHASATRLAAWKPTVEGLVILAEGAGDVEITSMPAGWAGDVIDQAGMHGVYLHGKEPTGWTALQEGAQWL